MEVKSTFFLSKLLNVFMCALFFIYPIRAFSQNLKVPEHIWEELEVSEKKYLQNSFQIEIFKQNNYLKVTNVQSINKSSAGTNSGSRMGSAYGQAAYLDNTNWRNYSATDQLNAALIGSVIGSLADRPAENKFHFRYTLEDFNGDVTQQDIITTDSFHHPVGSCVEKSLSAVVNSNLCRKETIHQFRNRLLKKIEKNQDMKSIKLIGSSNIVTIQRNDQKRSVDKTIQIRCKLGNLAPINTTEEKCLKFNGVIMQ